ncbi:MAG: DGQHR domain-containing protein [Treponema sp.]|nr:DGQHR domain-containing protein [Treponema sp.]
MEINVIPFDQPIGHFAMGVMQAKDILSISTIDRVEYDPESQILNGGPQRDLSSSRATEIARYAATVDATFPTPILLALKKDKYIPQYDENGKINKIEIPEISTSVSRILDGQHRIKGIELSNKIDDFELPVVFIFEPTEEEQALIFAIINGKQTKVPTSVIYSLYRVIEERNPYKVAHEIARAFNATEDSPYYRRLKMLGKRTQGSDEILSQGTFVNELLIHISGNKKNADIDFENARAHKKPIVRKDCIFNSFYLNNQDSIILRVLLNVFNAAKNVFPKEWENYEEFILSKTTGFIAIMRSLPHLMEFGVMKKSHDLTTFEEVFYKLKSILEQNNVQLINRNFGSSSSGSDQLKNYIIQAIKECE